MMKMASKYWLWIMLVLMSGIFAARIYKYVSEPDMKIEIVRYHRMDFDLEGVILSKKVRAGTLVISADTLKAGHEDILKFFRLGPSTFLSLSGARVRFSGNNGESWLAQSESAEMNQEWIELAGSPMLILANSSVKEYKKIRIGLKDGGISGN